MDFRRLLPGISTIVVAASAVTTIGWWVSMSTMGAMEMPGGWAMSMMWMRMPGQTWLGAGASFVGMWVVMMVAMMLPSLIPTLLRYREMVGTTRRLGWLTTLVATGYFAVWAVFGAIVFAFGSQMAAIAMEEPTLARAAPMIDGAIVLIGGVLQYTAWKARQLALCREASRSHLTPHADTATAGSSHAAWRHGWCLGLHCVQSCLGLTMVMLALGVMDLRVMAVVAAAVSVERLAPNGVRVARAIGVGVVALGLLTIAHAAGLG